MVRTDNLQISELNEPEERTVLDRITDIVTLQVIPRNIRARAWELSRRGFGLMANLASWASWLLWIGTTGTLVLVVPVYMMLLEDHIILGELEQEVARPHNKLDKLDINLETRY